MKTNRRAFTLIELMLVMAIMGLMATISIGGYRAMRLGMEERGVSQNVKEFLKVANQRAKIDGQPVAVVFWNETREFEDAEDPTKTLQVVGRAVAVRQSGRVSRSSSGYVVDEFGDLRHFLLRDSKGKIKKSSGDLGMRIYKMRKNQITHSRVSQYAELMDSDGMVMMSDPDWNTTDGIAEAEDREVKIYGYKILEGSSWKCGEAYGLEFAELTLPKNYIFGSGKGAYSTQKSTPRNDLNDAMFFDRSGSSGSIVISALRPGSQGELEPEKIGSPISSSSIENEK